MSRREQDRAELRSDVALMRDLGVARWTRGPHDIFLGPPPPKVDAMEQSPDKILERIKREETQRHETLFAASPIRPVSAPSEHLTKVKRAFYAENVAPRSDAPGRGGGKQTA